jgi:ABC-type transport system substrate-binding protein
VGVNVVELSPAAHTRNFADHEVDAFVWGWVADFPDPAGMIDTLLDFFQEGLYRDGRLTTLLGRARSLRDQDERLALYREFERLWIGEHVSVVPLHYRRQTLLVRPWVDGLWINPMLTSTLAPAVVNRPDSAPRPA